MIRALQLLREISLLGSVDFVSFSNDPNWPWLDRHIQELHETFPTVQLRLQRRTSLDIFFTRCKSALVSFFPRYAFAIAALRLPLLQPEWRAACGNALVVITYLDGLLQLNGIRISGRLVVDSQDIGFMASSARKGKAMYDLDVIRVFRREMALLEIPDDVLAISHKEFTFLDDVARHSKVWMIPPKTELIKMTRWPDISSPMLLFVGSASLKNAHGIKDLAAGRKHWTIQPKLVIAGKICQMLKDDPEFQPDSSVTLLGFVDDLRALYGQAAAVVCPVKGTGINIKILEALAHGVPVFAARSAIHALPAGFEACVWELDEARVSGYLSNPNSWDAASRAAKSYVSGPAFELPTRQFFSDVAFTLNSAA